MKEMHDRDNMEVEHNYDNATQQLNIVSVLFHLMHDFDRVKEYTVL
jgi:hypothetical protein